MPDTPMTNDETQPDGVQPIAADAVTDPLMAPVDVDAGGPSADKGDAVDQDELDEPSDDEAAAQMGELG